MTTSTGSRESQSTAVTSPRFVASGKRCASTRHGPSSISETYTVRASGKTIPSARSSPPYPAKRDITLMRCHPSRSTRGIRHRSHPRPGLQNARTGESGLHDTRHRHHTWLPSPCCMERSSYAVDQSRGSITWINPYGSVSFLYMLTIRSFFLAPGSAFLLLHDCTTIPSLAAAQPKTSIHLQ